ncbi:hypothetical protein NX059_009521 [Plenodomus lindquistii]|nr:hypothetical protein NX059_009521 [Plenodomus lindquistii]
MASPPKGSDHDRPAASTRSRSGLDMMLPTTIGKGNRSKSRTRPGPTPHMDRSLSSAMTDSFMADHRGSYRSAVNDQTASRLAEHHKTDDDDGLTPISNWAHLNFLKSQRNTLRNELRVQNLAGAEAKRSVSTLRRLAFRMAVNISVKEKQIATSAKNLSQSRKDNYLKGKDAEKSIQGLKRALRMEEKRNVEVLEALERASMLTLQYSTPKPKSQQHPQRSLLSPPPSPPTRLSNYSEPSLGSPRTPVRPSTFDWGLTPGLESPTDVRTSDSRLIQAKRDCDRALATCRSRILELQEECAQSNEANKLVLASRDDLEHEMKSHQSRIATLERSRAAVETTLSATRQQLAIMNETEDKLRRDLDSKAQEVSNLQHRDADKQNNVNLLRREKNMLEKEVQDRDSKLKELRSQTTSLQDDTRRLQDKLQCAESYAATLQDRLTKKEHVQEDLQKRLERGTQYVQLLEDKIRGFESGAQEYSKLQTELKDCQETLEHTTAALVTLESETASLRQSLDQEMNAHKQLLSEMNVNQMTISELKDKLAESQSALNKEMDRHDSVQVELESLRSSRTFVVAKLQAAEARVESLENFDHDNQAKLELLHDDNTSLEADLREARQSLFRLHEDKRMREAELGRMESSISELQEQLQSSERQVVVIQQELAEMHISEAATHQTHRVQLTEFEASLHDLQKMLAATDRQNLSLQEELHQMQTSKESAEHELTEAHYSKNNLQDWCNTVEKQLQSTENEREIMLTKVAELERDLNLTSASKMRLEERLEATLVHHAELDTLVSELQSTLKASRDASDKLEEAYVLAQKDGEASKAQVVELHEQIDHIKLAQEAAETRYHDSLVVKERLEEQLQIAQSKLVEAESEADDIRVELSSVQAEISKKKLSTSDLTASLEVLQVQYKSQQGELASTKSRLDFAEHEVKTLEWELSIAEEELGAIHRDKLRMEKHLRDALEANGDLNTALRTTREDRIAVEERLTSALGLSLQATSDLASARSQLVQADADNARLESLLDEKDGEFEALFQRSAELQDQLNLASAQVLLLRTDLSTTQSKLNEKDLKNQSQVTKLSAADDTIIELRQRETDLKEQLAQAEALSKHLKEESVHVHNHVYELEHSKAEFISLLSSTSAKTESLRAAYIQLENQLQTATRDNDDLTRELRATAMRLDIAEVEGIGSAAELLKADHAFSNLLALNIKLEKSEHHLSTRLALAEEDLEIVRKTNRRLETILERVTKDMDNAEAAVEESSKRFGQFVTESQAKLEAARNAKLRYKSRLSEKMSEMETLAAKNLTLHKQVDEQAEELDILKKGKAKLEETLSEKENYMRELRSSSDKRIRSLNSAYNGLRKEHEQRTQQSGSLNAHQSETELHFKDAVIEKMQASIDSYALLEREVESLREDKKTFQRIVQQLQQKNQQLQILQDWNEPIRSGSQNSRPHITVADEAFYSAPSSPSTRHTRSPRPDSVLSFGQPGERPMTRASAHSHDEDLDDWAHEVERVRMLRDETAIQLRDLRKSKHDLKKDLKHTEAELHRLEKEHKDKRSKNLLRKGQRPMTPFRSPTLPSEPFHNRASPLPPTTPVTPARPRTSSGLPLTLESRAKPSPSNRHSTIGISPDMLAASPHSDHRRWPTTLRSMDGIGQRPGTSHSLRQKLSHRPAMSPGMEEQGSKHRRRWSSGLKSLFRTEG